MRVDRYKRAVLEGKPARRLISRGRPCTGPALAFKHVVQPSPETGPVWTIKEENRRLTATTRGSSTRCYGSHGGRPCTGTGPAPSNTLYNQALAMKTGVVALAVVAAAVLATACSTGTWVDLAAFGAPRNCKDLDGKTHGKERVGAEILLGSSDVKETLAFFARATCSNVGKAWTTDFRCSDTGVQVKCK